MDLLGFAVFAALAITQPQLFGHGWEAFKRGFSKAGDHFPGAKNALLMWISEQFLKLAVILAVAEAVWYAYLPGSDSSLLLAVATPYNLMKEIWSFFAAIILPSTSDNMGYELYFVLLCVFQLVWAGINLFLSWGRIVTVMANDHSQEVDEDRIDSNEPDKIPREDVVSIWRHKVSFVDKLQKIPFLNFFFAAHPFLWLALVAGGWLLQGASLQYYAISYVPDFGDQQWLVLYGWFSKLVYGLIALTASGIIGWFTIKSTRLIEKTSTVFAKLIVSIPVGIEYDKNALAAIGGPIDILDEENLASKISWALTILFVPLMVFDIAIFLWPEPLIAGAVLVGITVTGILEYVFSRMGEGPKAEALADRTNRFRVIFKLGSVSSIIIFVLGNILAQTLFGWNIQIETGNFWYGVAYITHVSSFWFGVGCVGFLLVAQKYIRQVYKALAEQVKTDEAKGEVKGWTASPKRYISWVFLLGFSGAATLAFLMAFSAFVTACGANEKARLDYRINQEAITFENVTVNGNPVPVQKDKPWPLAEPVNGRVRVSFETSENAFGVVEFDSAKRAKQAGMPGYVTVDSSREKINGKFRHIAEFEVDDDFYGTYRIVMRNAEIIPPNPKTKTGGEVGDKYGRVATSAPFEIEQRFEHFAFYERWWIGLKDWWAGLWSDDGNNKRRPERTVVVVREPPPKPPRTFTGSSRQPDCGSGCKITPLKVEPELAAEVAAARARH